MEIQKQPENPNEQLHLIEGQKVHERNPEGDHTIVLVGGITEGVETQAGLSEALANEGYRVLSFDQTNEPTETDPEAAGYQARFHQAKSKQVGSILEQLVGDDQEATLVGHSQGGIFAVDAALEQPNKVDRVLLMNTAGLFEDSFPQLGARFGVETIRKTVTPKKLAAVQQIQGLKAITKEPRQFAGLKSFAGDAFDVGESDIREKVKQLREKGVKVDAFVGAKDQVFPWHLVERGLNPEGEVSPEEIAVDSISSYFTTKESRGGKIKQHKFASKWAGHDQPIIYPEQTARLISSVVTPVAPSRPKLWRPSDAPGSLPSLGRVDDTISFTEGQESIRVPLKNKTGRTTLMLGGRVLGFSGVDGSEVEVAYKSSDGQEHTANVSVEALRGANPMPAEKDTSKVETPKETPVQVSDGRPTEGSQPIARPEETSEPPAFVGISPERNAELEREAEDEVERMWAEINARPAAAPEKQNPGSS
jgi:pimeloyl-ACP methyl ester carboxylesterase